jgi:hypothetical protein
MGYFLNQIEIFLFSLAAQRLYCSPTIQFSRFIPILVQEIYYFLILDCEFINIIDI